MFSQSPIFLEKDPIEVRLAENWDEVRLAQNLRHRCFFPHDNPVGLDEDKYDEFADHLIAIDKTTNAVVGTYRLMIEKHAQAAGSYYSSSEFDLSFLTRLKGNQLELGRSCVDPDYRKSGVATLLWLGCGAYVSAYNIDVLFGCASFSGVDPTQHAQALSYLHYELAPPTEIYVQALTEQKIQTNILPRDEVDKRVALTQMPALIKGYSKMGGWFGREAAVDTDFDCLDLLLCISSETAPASYHKRFKKSDFVRFNPTDN